jgi:FkbM family methyltransferase
VYYIGKMGVRGKGYQDIISYDKGQKISLDLDDWVPFNIYFNGVYEWVQTKFFRNNIFSDMVIIDIGSHIGYYALQAAVRVGDSGHVHAFEPASDNFEKMETNIIRNGFTNISAYKFAVSDRCGSTEIFIGGERNTGTSGLSKPDNFAGRVERVDTITIDSWVEQFGIATVDLVKIDVEGSEIAVLKGGEELLKREDCLQLLIEMSDKHLRSQGSSSEALAEYMGTLGYEPFKITLDEIVHFCAEKSPYESLVLFRKDK